MGFVDTHDAACARSATSSATRCRPGRSRWSPTRARCSPRCCAPTGALEYSVVVSLRAGAGDARRPTTSPTRCRCPRPGSSGWCSRRCATRRGCGPALAEAAARDIPVVALTVGTSVRGQALVDAHSGAIAGSDAGWEALFTAYGVHRVRRPRRADRQPRAFAIGRRPRRRRRAAASRPCTTPEPSGCWSPTWPSGSASRSRDLAPATIARLAVAARPRARADQPARRLGHRRRHRGPVRRLPGRPRRRPRGGRGRAGGRPGGGVRRRRVVPAGAREPAGAAPTSRWRC